MLDKLNNEFEFNKNSLNLHSYQQELLASKIANIDTPKYTYSNLNFSKKFNQVLKNKHNNNKNHCIKKTNTHSYKFNHLKDINKNQVKTHSNNLSSRNKAVNIDLERINFVHNGLQYQADIVFINNKIRNIMNVLQG